jgi:hypothetical protein
VYEIGEKMGMFDSFHTNEGKEIQTKKLDCSLANYYIGDTVPNYELNFDGATGNYYLLEEYQNASVIVINNIFIDYVLDDNLNDLKTNTNAIFRSYLANPTLLSLKLAQIIKEKLNPQRIVLSKRLNAVKGILREYQAYQENPRCLEEKLAKLWYRHIERFQQGESLYSLLTEAINDEYTAELNFLDN